MPDIRRWQGEHSVRQHIDDGYAGAQYGNDGLTCSFNEERCEV